jgi:hypothetical protein
MIEPNKSYTYVKYQINLAYNIENWLLVIQSKDWSKIKMLLLGIIIIVLGSCEITDQNSRLLHLKNGHN